MCTHQIALSLSQAVRSRTWRQRRAAQHRMPGLSIWNESTPSFLPRQMVHNGFWWVFFDTHQAPKYSFSLPFLLCMSTTSACPFHHRPLSYFFLISPLNKSAPSSLLPPTVFYYTDVVPVAQSHRIFVRWTLTVKCSVRTLFETTAWNVFFFLPVHQSERFL